MPPVKSPMKSGHHYGWYLLKLGGGSKFRVFSCLSRRKVSIASGAGGGKINFCYRKKTFDYTIHDSNPQHLCIDFYVNIDIPAGGGNEGSKVFRRAVTVKTIDSMNSQKIAWVHERELSQSIFYVLEQQFYGELNFQCPIVQSENWQSSPL